MSAGCAKKIYMLTHTGAMDQRLKRAQIQKNRAAEIARMNSRLPQLPSLPRYTVLKMILGGRNPRVVVSNVGKTRRTENLKSSNNNANRNLAYRSNLFNGWEHTKIGDAGTTLYYPSKFITERVKADATGINNMVRAFTLGTNLGTGAGLGFDPNEKNWYRLVAPKKANVRNTVRNTSLKELYPGLGSGPNVNARVYNPNLKFNTTSNTWTKSAKTDKEAENLFYQMLDKLNKKRTGTPYNKPRTRGAEMGVKWFYPEGNH